MKNNITAAAALMGSTKSEAKTTAARENGAKGGRPPKGRFDSTFHRDGSVTIWDVYNQGWIRTSAPSDQLLSSFSRDEREKVEAHTA